MSTKNNLSQNLLEEINKYRTDPKKLIKEIEKVIISEKKNKEKKKLCDELTSFIQELKTKPALQPLKISEELSGVCTLRVDSALTKGSLSKEDDFNELAEEYAPGFNKINQIIESFEENAGTLLLSLLIGENDVKKTNRKVILDPTMRCLGISSEQQGRDNDILIIVLSDNIEPNDGTVEDIMNKLINRYRDDTNATARHLQECLTLDLNQTPRNKSEKSIFIEHCNKICRYLLEINSIKGIQRSGPLDIIAQELMQIGEKNKNIFLDQDGIRNIARTKINGFKQLYGVISETQSEPEKIFLNLFNNADLKLNENTKNCIFSKGVTYIGLSYSEKTKSLVIITCDEFAQGREVGFEESLVTQINLLRTNPKNYAKSIDDCKKAPTTPSSLRHLDTTELQKFLNKQKSIKEIILHSILCEAAQEFLDLHQSSKNLYAEDEEILKMRLSHFCTLNNFAFEIIESGGRNAFEVIANLLIFHSNEEENKTIFTNEKLKYFGYAREVKGGKAFTVLIFTDSVAVLENKPFVEDLFVELNHLRQCPKSYVKIMNGIANSNNSNSEAQTSAVILTKQNEAKYMGEFFMKTRAYGKFAENSYLTKAAETRLANCIQEGGIIHRTREDLNVFLSDFCTGYNVYYQIMEKGYDTAREFILDSLLNFNDEKRTTKYTIFNPSVYYCGAAYDLETKIGVAIFCDQVEAKDNYNIIPYTTERIVRPEFTKDEDEQISIDFKKLDFKNEGFLIPKDILNFVELMPVFKQDNPVYYDALTNLNTIENNVQGINEENWKIEINKVMRVAEDENWNLLIDVFIDEMDKQEIDYPFMLERSKQLNYDISEPVMRELVQKLAITGGFEEMISSDPMRSMTLSRERILEVIKCVQIRAK